MGTSAPISGLGWFTGKRYSNHIYRTFPLDALIEVIGFGGTARAKAGSDRIEAVDSGSPYVSSRIFGSRAYTHNAELLRMRPVMYSRHPFQLRIITVFLILAGADWCGCATQNGPQHNAARLQSVVRRPEAISLLGKPLYADPPASTLEELESDLAAARTALADHPMDPARIVWVGRRLGYLWRMREAVEVFSQGIAGHPDYAPLYRHRGHRLISLRRFDDAIVDLEKACALIEGQPDRIEPNGVATFPSAPLSTTAYNVWYHLGLACYLKGDFERALAAYRRTLAYATRFDDNVVATTDWLYMTLRALGRDDEAAALLDRITPEMHIVANGTYYRRLLTYKGLLKPQQLLNVEGASDLELATMGYGLAQWYHFHGDEAKAREILGRVASGAYWPAFGVIAAEAQLARQPSAPKSRNRRSELGIPSETGS